MTEKERAKVLEFLQKRQAQREANPPEPSGLYFGVYALHREHAVVLSLPMMELILINLMGGTSQDQREALAQSLAASAGVEIPQAVSTKPSPPPV